MKKFFMAVIALMMTMSASAQFYIYYSDGTVAKVDSISIVDPNTSSTGSENGYDYVDLGLSVKWATCNVGATKPEEYGDYFAWGETKSKYSYSIDDYEWGGITWYYDEYGVPISQERYYTKYSTHDHNSVLEKKDDAARVNWGGGWRMPTKAEQEELREQCTWIWTSQDGVNGYKVTSKSNGNSIFLPAAGYRDGSSLYYAGSDGRYWSSSLDTNNSYNAYALDFDSDIVAWDDHLRESGYSVRPVCQ